MTKLEQYFNTDWAAMTATDWFGFLLNVVVFILFVIVYFWVFNPKNKQKLESHRTMVLDEDKQKSES